MANTTRATRHGVRMEVATKPHTNQEQIYIAYWITVLTNNSKCCMRMTANAKLLKSWALNECVCVWKKFVRFCFRRANETKYVKCIDKLRRVADCRRWTRMQSWNVRKSEENGREPEAERAREWSTHINDNIQLGWNNLQISKRSIKCS